MIALILAGGYDQISLITSLRNRGFKTLLVDFNEAPIAAGYADTHVRASTLDVDAVTKIARESLVSLVVTACTDQALIVAAEVSERLNLPFPLSRQLALALTNKRWMKNVLVEAGIPTAKHTICDSEDEFVASLQRLSWPLVIKPVDANSSKGVSRVDERADAVQAYRLARAASRSGVVLAEEFTSGRELSIDAWVDANGDAALLMVSESLKNPSPSNGFPISASLVLPELQIWGKAHLPPILSQIAKAFGLTNCPLLVQAIMNNDIISVIELSARMGGGCKHHLIRAVTGVDTMELLVDTFLGKAPPLPGPSLAKHVFAMKYLYSECGVFSAVDGLEELKKDKVLDAYYITKPHNTEVKGQATSSDRVGAFLCSAEDRLSVKKLIASIYAQIAVRDINGRDLKIADVLDEL